MASFAELKAERLEKLELLKKAGVNPFPASTKRETSLADFNDDFAELEKSKRELTIAGRVMSKRVHGALTFADIYDGTGRTQLYLKVDEMDEEVYKFFSEVVDEGDFIEATGQAFTTQRGQQSLAVESWQMLTKSIAPLPSEHFGIKDDDTRYRKRYLDILLNPELRATFERRSKFWRETRRFMEDAGFIEVETPTLEITTGGAEATPFKTYHEDYDLDVFLRISVGELWQKRLMAAGFPKTFEIGRVYRNEGSSPEHLQEFTNMEFYWAYSDYKKGMKFVEKMLKHLAQTVWGTTEFSSRGFEFSLADDNWPVIEYVDKVKEMTGIDVLEASVDEMKAKLDELKVEYDGDSKERLVDTLWKYCRKQIAGPVWLINHPKLVSPLSKALESDPRLTERCQLILAGAEVNNGFSELNDPIDQRERFEAQQELLSAGDSEAMMPEWEFVEMLEYGIPPTFGFGFGERFFAFLEDKPLREVTLFPLMRPKDGGGKDNK